MLFLVKKIVSLMLMPLSITFLLMLAGLLMLALKKTAKAGIFFAAAFVWLFLFSYAPVSNSMLNSLEKEYPSLLHAPENTKYIYVLGIGHSTNKTLPITSQLNPEAVVRLNEGIRLYRELDGKARLVLSGYSGPHDPTPQALMLQRLALALGVPRHDTIVSPSSRDTEEEARAAAEITNGKPMILVTSAYHMPRAMTLFRKAGLTPAAAPTYHRSNPGRNNYMGIFSMSALNGSTIAFHEFLGSAWIKLKGYFG